MLIQIKSWINIGFCNGFGLDIIFIQRVVCFLSPSLGKGIENTQRVILPKPWEILFIKCLNDVYLLFFCENFPTDFLPKRFVNNSTPLYLVRYKYKSIY